MFSQPKLDTSNDLAHDVWVNSKITTSALYATLIIGYLLSVFSANHLSVSNVALFILIQILYCVVFIWMMSSIHRPRWRKILGAILIGGLTFASGMMGLSGIYFDWVLYFATASIYFSLFSARRAIIASLLLYIMAGVNVAALNQGTLFNPGWIGMLAGFGFVAAFSRSTRSAQIQRMRFAMLLRQLERSNKALEETHAQLQAYANQVEELAVVRERTRLAREIHDTLGHYLTILSIQLETISKLQERDPTRVAGEVADARHVATQAMQEVRNAVTALRPTSIATLNLIASLSQLGEEFRAVAQETELTLDLETQLPELSADLQLALYRAVQEALTNVRKHAHSYQSSPAFTLRRRCARTGCARQWPPSFLRWNPQTSLKWLWPARTARAH